jgi:hypothetical protein
LLSNALGTGLDTVVSDGFDPESLGLVGEVKFGFGRPEPPPLELERAEAASLAL